MRDEVLKPERQKLTRKQRRTRAELKRRELRVKILQYMETKIPEYSTNGNLNLEKWTRDGEAYIQELIRKNPQEAEMIRRVSRDVEKILLETLRAAIDYQRKHEA